VTETKSETSRKHFKWPDDRLDHPLAVTWSTKTNLLLLSWHALLGVHSVKCKQRPEWSVLSHINCFVHGEVLWFQVLQYNLYLSVMLFLYLSRWPPLVVRWKDHQHPSSSHFVRHSCNVPKQERHRDWTMTDRWGCLVVRLTSSRWFHLIPSSMHRHHSSRASITCTTVL